MVTTSCCKTCDKDFSPPRNSKGIFCSLECYWNSKKRVKDYKCLDCDKQISPVKSTKRCRTCAGIKNTRLNHDQWKGAMVSYRALHHWVQRELGTPIQCESCETTGTGHKMHWANISGDYKKEISDWLRLCPKCHGEFDSQKNYQHNRNGLS